MMEKKLPELAITYLRFGTTLFCSWPLSTSATSSEKIINEIKWWSLFLLAWSLELPIIYTIYLQRNNFIELTTFVCFSSSVAHGIIKMIICRRHYNNFRYMDEAFKIVRPIVLATVATATVSIVFGGIHIVGNEPFSVKVQFVGMDVAYSAILFMSTFAAENLMGAMNEVKWSLYDSPWLNSSNRVNKLVIFVMQRLNKLPRISLGGFIPELSLNYYAVYLSKTMSFFTTLHAMLDKMNAKAIAN